MRKLLILLLVATFPVFAAPLKCVTNKIVEVKPNAINFFYPRIAAKSITVKKINNTIENRVINWIKTDKKDYQLIKSYPTIYFCSDRIFSATIDIESDLAFPHSMAHPVNDLLVFNFSVQNGQELLVKDLFWSHADYLTIISRYTYESLLKQFSINQKDPAQTELLKTLRDGTAPKLENFKNFALTPTGILIIFPYYQVGPRYFGEPKVLIPYSQLHKIMRVEFINLQ